MQARVHFCASLSLLLGVSAEFSSCSLWIIRFLRHSLLSIHPILPAHLVSLLRLVSLVRLVRLVGLVRLVIVLKVPIVLTFAAHLHRICSSNTYVIHMLFLCDSYVIHMLLSQPQDKNICTDPYFLDTLIGLL